jgi:DNA helicase II / ATP-dependent DNA helicase PcrA
MAIDGKTVISMQKVQALLDELNPQQRLAAETLYGPVLVLAGAGSGKTKTLTYRIANMLAHGIPARELFVATFTNKAAREMKDRIALAVGEENVRDLWMGTFHSLCVRILRKHGHYLGYESNFSIYDTSDSLKLIERIYKMMKVDEKMKPGYALHYIDRAKNNLWTPEYCAYNCAESNMDQVASLVYRHFQDIMKENNAMDFGDLIMNVVTLLDEIPEVRDYWQNRFKFVYSDEYQDANHAQFQLLRLLAYPQNNLFIVGDDYQAIYGFRGSDISNILSFEMQYFPCTTVYLEQNYRSKETIVHAGNEIIRHNTMQKEKTLRTDKKGGAPIVVVKTENEHKEAAFVAYMIQKKVKEGKNKYGDFAVLYRTNDQSAPFEQLFMHNMIPYKVVGGTGFFQREEIKDVAAYLRVIQNRKDDAAMLRILNKPSRGIGDTSQNHIIEYANAHKVSIYRALKAVDDIPEIKKGTATKIKDFLALLDHLEGKTNLDILLFVRYMLDQTGYWKMWDEKHTKEAEEKLENIQEFMRLVERYKQENPDKTLSDFLQEVSLLMDFDQDAKENSVRMMSIHASKGLEFPVVFIVGCNEGLFPSWRSREQKDIEEERRLAYVGITRAGEELFMTYTEQRTNFRGGMQVQEPSRFLNELPSEIVQKFEIGQKR